ANDIISYIERDLNTVHSLISLESSTWENGAKSTTDLALEITSFLYAIGAQHRVWRRWASLTAFGLFLQGKFLEAAQYACFGGEWEFIKILPSTTLKSQQISDQVFWKLVHPN
ncbi:MAG: hypothetical protein ACKO2Z_25300, partial [Sphaerospermopsis kisseleviana]